MPEQKLNTVFDMGTYEMRLLVCESAASGDIQLSNFTSVSTPKDFIVSTIIDSPIIDPVSIKTVAANLVKKAQIPYEKVLLLLPDHSTIVSSIVAPPRFSPRDTEESVKEDLEPVMPLPYQNWHVVYKTIGTWESDEVLLAMAIIKNNLLEVGGIIQTAGANPYVVDINFLNVANLAEKHLSAPENRGHNICMVHLGHESTSIGVFKDGQLRTLQNRPIGAYDFTKQISRHFHVTESEADNFKQSEVFFLPEPSAEQDGLYNFSVIRNVFASLVKEIFGTIESYLTRFREFTIQEIILSGGGANFANIATAIASNMNTKVFYISDLYTLHINGKEMDAKVKNTLAAPCGCFLRD